MNTRARKVGIRESWRRLLRARRNLSRCRKDFNDALRRRYGARA